MNDLIVILILVQIPSCRLRVTWKPSICKLLFNDKFGIKTNLSSSPQDSVSDPDSLYQDPTF